MIKKRNKTKITGNREKWRLAATLLSLCPRLTFHCLLCQDSFSRSLSLSLCPKPLQTLTSPDVSSFFADFSFRPSSPMYILYPFTSSAHTHTCTRPSAVTHTPPSAVMACIQQIHWAKPRASVKIYEEHK